MFSSTEFGITTEMARFKNHTSIQPPMLPLHDPHKKWQDQYKNHKHQASHEKEEPNCCLIAAQVK
jgi:hypothetical protein